MEERDIIIIGGGPAGYVAALRATQLGGKVTLVEDRELGGICLNRGCIPTKFLLHSTDVYQSMKFTQQYGISVDGVKIDLAEVQTRKNTVVATLVAGLQGRLDRSCVEIIKGWAKLVAANKVEVDLGKNQKQTIQTRKIIIATGSKPVTISVPGADSQDILNSDKMLSLDKLPRSLIIIGGGAIGVEMATIFDRLGCKVSIVELMPHCLPNQDGEIAMVLEDILREDGIQVYCNARVSRIDDAAEGKSVVYSDSEGEQKLRGESVAITIGYAPNIDNLGVEECGIALDGGRIKVNERIETSVPGIYAAGDVVGGMMLAHVGFAEGKVAAENAMGKDSKIDYQAIPQGIFTLPEVASVGLTEAEAIAQGHELRIGRFPFVANGMAHILGECRGLVKIITEQKYGQVLGVHIVGPRATSIIPEAALAMKMEATFQDIAATIHAHPTLSEALWEAALDVMGETIHYSSTNQ